MPVEISEDPRSGIQEGGAGGGDLAQRTLDIKIEAKCQARSKILDPESMARAAGRRVEI